MATICDNPECAYHQPLPHRESTVMVVEVVDGHDRVSITRHMYRNNAGFTLFLCDACHAAVQLVSKSPY